jgi:mannose-1-phosphate guanylyltransferase
MITVIIAGGSGTRLWPLSTPDYPKHLLRLNGQDKTLLQNTYERAKLISSAVYVLPEISHAHHVKDQLADLTDDAFIIEPARRGTASCIVAALEHVGKFENADEPIAFLSADHYIRDSDGFAHSFRVAGKTSQKEGRIVLVGVEPDHPATGFGYIQKDGLFDENSFVYNVDSFKEKPDFDIAKKYVKSGNYLWNCGYFVGSLNTFKNSMKQYAPGMYKNYEALMATKNADEYQKTYLGFKNDTIDYALIEHVDDLLVVPASFDWMDLGSYADLHKAVESDQRGNHVYGDKVEIEDVENSFIQNYDNKPMAVIGLDNVVVINTKHGIVVARKDMAQKVGDVSKRFKKD